MVPTSRGSLRRASSTSALLVDDLNDSGIVRAWSILEAYLHNRGAALARRDIPIQDPAPPLLGYLYDQTEAAFRGRFPEMSKFWESALEVPLASAPSWPRLDFFRQLRNLIVHSVGEVRVAGKGLSKKFRREVQLRLVAARLSPTSYEGRLPMTDADFDELCMLIRDFVLWTEKAKP